MRHLFIFLLFFCFNTLNAATSEPALPASDLKSEQLAILKKLGKRPDFFKPWRSESVRSVVLEKVLLSGDFACLPAASPMMRSYEYECYVDDILAEIEKENPPLYGNMRENRGVYNKMIRQSA